MDATIHNSSNCSTFESPMEGDKADDVQGIHPAPVQADDTSNRTSAVPGHGLPLSDPSSSNAGSKLLGFKVTGYSCACHAKCIGHACWYEEREHLILAVELHCHKVQGMTEVTVKGCSGPSIMCHTCVRHASEHVQQ